MIRSNLISPVTVIIAMFALFSLPCSNSALAEPTNQPFVLGQVMVKFKTASNAHQLLNKANQSNPANLMALAPVIETLAKNTGIPLIATQLLSGDWLLLNIDSDKLLDAITQQLRQQHTIANVQLIAKESSDNAPVAFQDIAITFKDNSAEYQRIAAQASDTAQRTISELEQSLIKIINLPLHGKIDSQKRLVIQLDTKQLTIQLSDRLQREQPLVDSVQLNYLAKTMGIDGGLQ